MTIVAIGTAAIVLTAGFVRFSFDGLARALVRGGLGHLEIAAAEEVTRRGPGTLDRAAVGLEGWRELRQKLESLPGVSAVGANLHLMGLVQAASGRSASFLGVGVEPDRERRAGFVTRILVGEPLPASPAAAGDDVVLLARGLADSLGVTPGESVTLVATQPDGMLNALDVRVLGVVTTGVTDLDGRWLKVPLATAARLLQTTQVSNLLVSLEDEARLVDATAAARALVADRSPALMATPWHERAPFYGQVRDLYTAIFRFLGAIVLLLVVLASSNTLVMTVFERMRELGVLRAIGTTPSQVARMLLAEALCLGVLGSAAGALLGLAGVAAVNAAALTMPPPPGAVERIDLRLALVPEAFWGAGLLMTTVLVLAALLPIVRAIRVRVVEALGHV